MLGAQYIPELFVEFGITEVTWTALIKGHLLAPRTSEIGSPEEQESRQIPEHLRWDSLDRAAAESK